MKLIYYKKSVPNFGDDLNLYLWPALEPALFNESTEEGFVGIGTIIGMPVQNFRKLTVFTSGAGNDPIARWKHMQVDYAAVRGPVSAAVLGLPQQTACTDGAILSPLVWPMPAGEASGGIVVIPHWETLEHPGWPEVERLTGYRIVDPRRSPQEVIAQIQAARLVITESLHGAIIADTYGIPWVAFSTSKNFAFGKWGDWTLSLGMPCELWMVPPPSASTIVRFGQLPLPYGTMFKIDAEIALADMQRRMVERTEARTSATDRLKGWIKRSALYQAGLRLSPERTAEALTKIAGQSGYLSEETVRRERADDMRQRLSALANRKG